MCAGTELRRDVVVAGEARGRCRLRRVPGLGRAGVAVYTTKVLVNTVCQGLGFHRDGLTFRIHQARGRPMAGKTVIRSVECGRPEREDHNEPKEDIKSVAPSLSCIQALRGFKAASQVCHGIFWELELGQNAHVSDRLGTLSNSPTGFLSPRWRVLQFSCRKSQLFQRSLSDKEAGSRLGE